MDASFPTAMRRIVLLSILLQTLVVVLVRTDARKHVSSDGLTFAGSFGSQFTFAIMGSHRIRTSFIAQITLRQNLRLVIS